MPDTNEVASLIMQVEDVLEELRSLLPKLVSVESLPQAYNSLHQKDPSWANSSFKEFAQSVGEVWPELKTVSTELQSMQRRVELIANVCEVLHPNETGHLTVALRQLNLDAKSFQNSAGLDEFKSLVRLLQRLKDALSEVYGARALANYAAYAADRELRAPPVPQKPTLQLKRFEQLELYFTSEHRVQVICPGWDSAPRTFEELGFGDGRRTGKPNKAWNLLFLMAQNGGSFERNTVPITATQNLQKTIGALRTRLREQFGCTDDPILWIKEDRSYRTAFRVRVSDQA